MSSVQAIYLNPKVAHKNAMQPHQNETFRSIETSDGITAEFFDSEDGAAQMRLMLPRIRIDAFIVSKDLASIFDRVAADRRAARAEVVLHQGGFKEAVDQFRDRSPAHLLIIEDPGTSEELERNIEALADYCPPSTRLIVIGSRNDIALYRRLTRIGVSDYLVQPISPSDLLGCILSIFGDTDQNELGTVLAIIGARGGSGASTVAHNVAASLSGTSEATTLLVDADIFGTAALQFDFNTPQGFVEAVKEGEALDYETLDRLVHWRDKRLGVLSAPHRPDESLAPEAGSLRHLIEQARRLAQFVVLDLPHGWNPWIAEALASSDRIGLVTTLDLPSLRNSRTLLDMIQKLRLNDRPPDIILNRVPPRGKPPVSPADYVRILGRQMAATIPLDPAVPSAEMSGRVLIEGAPNAPAAKAIGTLTAQMIGRGLIAEEKSAPKSGLGRLLKGKRT